MEIRKRKDGSTAYRAKFYNGNMPITKTFDRKTDAKAWIAEMRRRKQQGELYVNEAIEVRTFESAFENWFKTNISTKSIKTQSDYRSAGRKYLIPMFGDILLKDFKAEHGDQLLRKLVIIEKTAPRTTNKIMSIMKQVFSFCEERKWLKDNPLRFFKKLKQDQGRIDFLESEEIDLLLNANEDQEFFSLIVLALNTGMRIGELCGLKWDRVNFSTGQIEVSRSLSRSLVQERTKTSLIRQIPMNAEVRTILKELHLKSNFNQFVFTRKNGLPYTADHFSQRYFAPALNRANVRNVPFHILRHTYASHFMMNGGSLYDLQKLLGHTSIVMTQRYAHLAPHHLQKAASVVQFGSNRPKLAPSKEGLKDCTVISMI